MVHNSSNRGALVPRVIVGLTLLDWPRVGSAQGTWSVISLPQHPGEVIGTAALAVNTAGNLFVADSNRIQRRDAQGNWYAIATSE